MTDNDTPRIYVACLSAYNNGKLHGRWIDCIHGRADIEEAIADMLAASPEPDAEEYAIHDAEGWGFRVEESHDLAELAQAAQYLGEYGPVLGELVDEYGLADAVDMMENCYLGVYADLEDWAWDYLDNAGELEKLPTNLKHYFDYKAFGRDCEINGDIITVQLNYNEVHVFSGR